MSLLLCNVHRQVEQKPGTTGSLCFAVQSIPALGIAMAVRSIRQVMRNFKPANDI